MLVRTFSAVVQGLQPVKIEVEVDNTIGTPQFVIIGLPTKAIDEAKERITAALLNCNIRIRAKRTIVNLAPADVRKTGSGLELAIAVGLLKLYEELPLNTDQTMFFGELSLDGSIKAVRGALPLVVAAKKMGFTSVVLPDANSAEVQTISGITIHPVHQFLEVIQSLRQEIVLPVLQHTPFQSFKREEPEVDFADIVGQSMAKRALEIAAAGGHNLFLIGPPGAGKSMLAQGMSEILPPLTQGEATEITGIYSIAGLLGENRSFITSRPFRSPHHSTSLAGLTGGGVPLLPGEVSLAHNGVLFLDEMPEFPRYCLEALRQPLETRSITLTRASGSFSFPARFSLIAAANPCPCGFFGSKLRVCQCSRQQRHLYANRISGPLLDRIDLQVWTSETPVAELHAAHFTHGKNIDSTKHIGERVARARQKQQDNFKQHTLPISCNAELSTKQVKSYCHLKQEAQVFLNKAGRIMRLSARGYTRAIKVSQTIADLASSPMITEEHIAEALQYRSNIWVTNYSQ